MKCKVCFLFLLIAFCLISISCDSGFVIRDMILNNSSVTSPSTDGSGDGGSGDNGGDADEGELLSSIKVSNTFMYIMPNGTVHESYTGSISDLQKKFSPAASNFNTEYFNEHLFWISGVNDSNIVGITFKDDSRSWSLSDASRNEYTYSGDDFDSKGYATTDITMYQYRAKNPLYSGTGIYNTYVYDSIDDSTESLLKRFQFYRWQGKSSAGGLDNYMIALDTYTGLVFTFTEIESWATIVGNEVPQSYLPLELFHTKKYFFEYDPCGYVDANGNVVYEDWYKADLLQSFDSAKASAPPLTGLSPYAIENEKTIDAYVEDQKGYPISGILNVRTKYFKNVNLKTIFDVPFFGEITLNSIFDYKIGVSLYEGSDADAPNEATIIVAGNGENLDISQVKNFDNAAQSLSFVESEKPLNLELDIGIIRQAQTIGGVGVPETTIRLLRQDGGVPKTLLFNRDTYAWEDGSGFSLRAGEKKEYIVVISTGDGDLEVCYELEWSQESKTESGSILVPVFSVDNASEAQELTVSGASSNYTVTYTDATSESMFMPKDLHLNLHLYNLDENAQPVTITSVFESSHMLKSVKIDNSSLAFRGGVYGSESIPISISLESVPWAEENAVIMFLLVYPNSGYDSVYSLKELRLTVFRNSSQWE